jgi:hypothetical protein
MKLILALFVGAILSVAPVLMASGNNVFAQNSAAQIISQSQAAEQLGICISGDFTLISCNNLSDQDQTNFGNNAANQNDESGDGNRALQVISQDQDSDQTGLCVSGDGTFFSCNNVNEQDQTNFGNNALLQNSEGDDDDGYGDYGWKGYKGSYGNSYDNDGNTAAQVISQDQDSDQDSACVSGGDTAGSCNNFNRQSQTNYGNNALLQNR